MVDPLGFFMYKIMVSGNRGILFLFPNLDAFISFSCLARISSTMCQFMRTNMLILYLKLEEKLLVLLKYYHVIKYYVSFGFLIDILYQIDEVPFHPYFVGWLFFFFNYYCVFKSWMGFSFFTLKSLVFVFYSIDIVNYIT